FIPTIKLLNMLLYYMNCRRPKSRDKIKIKTEKPDGNDVKDVLDVVSYYRISENLSKLIEPNTFHLCWREVPTSPVPLSNDISAEPVHQTTFSKPPIHLTNILYTLLALRHEKSLNLCLLNPCLRNSHVILVLIDL